MAEILRPDLLALAELIPSQATVLDLGCGDGELLLLLAEKGIRGRGVEISEEGVRRCVSRGLSVLQGNVDEGLADYPDGSFDYVILSQTLPYLDAPRFVLHEMLRVGRQAIVSFTNMGYWRCRLRLLLDGRTMADMMQGKPWYAAPRQHMFTVNDFRDLCLQEGIRITRAIYLDRRGRPVHLWPNLLAWTGIFLLAAPSAERP